MNIVKEQFQLLKNTPNILDLSPTDLKSISIERGGLKVEQLLRITERRIDHFTKEAIFSVIGNPKTRQKIHVVVHPDYILPVSFNRPTRGVVINIAGMPFQTDDISRIDPRNIYACLIYGLTLSALVLSKVEISQVSAPIINYFLSLFMRLFGKKYGLLGPYSREINKLKFLISCYILTSFFAETKDRVLLLSSSTAFFDYKPIQEKLDAFDFSNIEDFISSLSQFKVMPGINKYTFASQVLKSFSTINFIPSLEDPSRFIASLLAASFKGSQLIPTFISTYNEDEYAKIIRFGYSIFKGS